MKKIIQTIQKLPAGLLYLIDVFVFDVFWFIVLMLAAIFGFLSAFSFFEMISCGGDCTDTYNGQDLVYSGTNGFLISITGFLISVLVLWGLSKLQKLLNLDELC